MVVLKGVAPEGVKALRALGLPVGLVLVEIGGACLADQVRDGLAPRQAGVAPWVVVEYVDQQWQLRHGRARLQGLGALLRRDALRLGLWQLAQGLIEVGRRDAPGLPGA